MSDPTRPDPRSEQEETMLLRRALSGEATRRTQEQWEAQCSIEVCDADGNLVKTYVVPATGLTIGRAADRGIRLLDRTVSRQHARIELADGKYWLDDTGSLNDTLLDGAAVRGRAELYDGAVLTIGLHVLRVSIR